MFDRLLRFSARLTPLAPAVSDGDRHLSFRQFDRAIDGIAAALDAAGVRAIGADRVAGIVAANQYQHLALILACARIGIGTVSLLPQTAPLRALCRVGFLIADQAALSPDLLVGDAWFIGLPEASAPDRPTIDPDAIGRVQLSSGTTGLPKAVGMSWANMERRIEHTWNRRGFDRLLSLIGPESGSLPLFLNCWARGGCVLFSRHNIAELVAELPFLSPNGLLAAPVQIRALIDALPAQSAPIPELRVALGGAGTSRALQQLVAARLGIVTLTYASTEAGVVTIGLGTSVSGEGAAGWVAPWAEVEAVDAEHRPLAPGTSGRIRIRGSDVVDRYLDGSADDAERFRDGWFYPGDIGRVDADGLVTIEGREDEVMNFGGEKFLPDAIEAPVRAVAGVRDVAAFALEDAAGVAQPWLAVVRDGDVAEGAIGRAITLPGLPPIHIAWIDVIPRTPLGKIQRETLREAARRLA